MHERLGTTPPDNTEDDFHDDDFADVDGTAEGGVEHYYDPDFHDDEFAPDDNEATGNDDGEYDPDFHDDDFADPVPNGGKGRYDITPESGEGTGSTESYQG